MDGVNVSQIANSLPTELSLDKAIWNNMTPELLTKFDSLIIILKAAGIIFIIYIVILITLSIMNVIRNIRIRKIYKKVNEMDEKLDILLKKGKPKSKSDKEEKKKP